MHKAFRPFAPVLWLLLAGLAAPLHAQSLQDPGYRYYEVGDLDAAPAAHTEPAMMLMGGGE
ncbi:MAG: peptidase, partial [Stenotrophomonas sp.]